MPPHLQEVNAPRRIVVEDGYSNEVADVVRNEKFTKDSFWRQNGQASWNQHVESGSMTNQAILTTQVVHWTGGHVTPANQPIDQVWYVSGTTAANVPTNYWAVVADQNFNIIAKSTDLLTTAWSANTAKGFTLSATWTPDRDTPVYVGLMVKATTPPSLMGFVTQATAQFQMVPYLSATSDSGLTTPAAYTSVGSRSASGFLAYCYLGYSGGPG